MSFHWEGDGKDQLSLGSLNQILYHHLGVWKHCTCWLPHQLTEEQRKGRAEWCLHMLHKCVHAEGRCFEKNWTRQEIHTYAQISTSRN